VTGFVNVCHDASTVDASETGFLLCHSYVCEEMIQLSIMFHVLITEVFLRNVVQAVSM
jgi:hypothetical protein